MKRAFTLVELLVVIAIFVLLLAIAVPAFSSMLYSSEQSLAENSLRIGISAARDAAIRGASGGDAAAVFFFDPVTGRTSIVPCVRAGSIKDEDPTSPVDPPPLVDREIFVPVAGFQPVQLPRGWSLRGYAGPGTIDGAWYERTYVSTAARNRGNWLFPETGFYDEERGDDGYDRQTFMIRFEGGTGSLRTPDGVPVLVLAPSPSIAFRTGPVWNIPGLRADNESDGARFVRRVMARPATGAGALTILVRRQLLGEIASDTVLAKSVGQIALYNEKRLANALGVRLDPTTGSLYRDVSPSTGLPAEPTFVNMPTGNPLTDQYVVYINDWIEGHLVIGGNAIDSDSRVFTVQRFLGTLQEMTGSAGGQGVGGT
jgi:prepilin-type N-terminal cleavage/methylation domain-containing protein